MKPTPEQVRQALANHRRPGRTHAAKVRDAMQHAQLSKTKPAASAKANGLNNIFKAQNHYGPKPD